MNKRWLFGLLLLAGIGSMFYARGHLDLARLLEHIESVGPAAAVLFILVYAGATVLMVPASLLTLTGGALFGPVLGTLWNLLGATGGAMLSFLVARYLAGDLVRRRAGSRLQRLLDGVEAEGWRFVAFTRLVPLFPFNLLNYAFGVTGIRFDHYAITSAICMIPGAIAYSYLGYAGREALGGGADLVEKGVIALSLLAAASLLPHMVGRWRRRNLINVDELQQLLDAHSDVALLDVRTAAEFAGELGHIGAAQNIELSTLPARIEALRETREKVVVIVCLTDRRSTQARTLLQRAGFTDVRVLRGGMTAWHRRGLPVSGGRHTSVD